MKHCALLLLSLLVLTAGSCTRSDPAPDSEAGTSKRASGPARGSDAGADQAAKPIAITDARLDKYLAFRKEFNQSYAGRMKDAASLAKTVDSKGNDVSKTVTVVNGIQRIGEKYEKEVNALRAKNGFTEDEDDRLWSAISDVVTAKVSDNPVFEDSLKSIRELQAKGGEEKKVADETLKSLEDQEKQGLAAARSKYGDTCIDLLSKRARELSQFQANSIKEMAGQPVSEQK